MWNRYGLEHMPERSHNKGCWPEHENEKRLFEEGLRPSWNREYDMTFAFTLYFMCEKCSRWWAQSPKIRIKRWDTLHITLMPRLTYIDDINIYIYLCIRDTYFYICRVSASDDVTFFLAYAVCSYLSNSIKLQSSKCFGSCAEIW